MQYEVMAPVGSRESLAAALKAGADSIYFGIESLNMRAHSASRFTIKDLHEIAQRCDELGVKSYLTVNTIIYGEDLALMREICDAAKAAHISAVIAADVAVLSYCRTIGQEVHLSTQLNISNEEALRFYSAFADVVVLARELKLEQVKELRPQVVENYKQRLLNNINSIKADINFNEEDVLKEVLLFSDRVDITEEISRLESHFKQLEHEFEIDEISQGKKIEFIFQEVFREFNTMGVKSNMYEISKLVVESKNELEKMREQIMNIE